MGGVITFGRFRQQRPKKPSREVRIRTGLITGFLVDIDSQREVEIFLGIPFAQPPIGEKRFKKPEPPSDWDGTLACTRFGPRAPQADFFWERWSLGVGKSEDCLNLNVFAPTWSPPNNEDGFAVMVYVHGGGYVIDSAVKYGDVGIAKYLCRHDVVVVTIQYRLGLLGFFSTGDENCAGNLGLWDQTMALQWVQDNIHAFKGDPRRVTVFGQSAGGASVDLLTLSPHSRNLFQQVIPMAGNAECEWATVTRGRLVDYCRQFAKSKGFISGSYNSKANADMLKWLRGRPAKEFERALIGRKGVDTSKLGLDLAPLVGHDPTDFFPKPLHDLRKEAPKKNAMAGVCEQEGLLFAVVSPNNMDEKGFDRLLSVCISEDLHLNFKELRAAAKQLYMKDVDKGDKQAMAKAFVKLYSDVFLNTGTSRYVRTMVENGNKVYFYSFNHFNPRSFGVLALKMPFKAATHCTELSYLFGRGIVFKFKLNDEDRKMIDLMSKMWTNFVKYGNPNGPYEDSTVFDFLWEPSSEGNNFSHLSITNKCQMLEEFQENRFEFWRNLRIAAKSA
ncbi:unnamed protein product, partial [Mesorhabditis belari]|uniref:Carboxylesterase type B domain-containing protein n=1 Tax=Mesorhabditis belari TaxID=2138241 RepID=A0AAF3J684_9BILA